MEIILRKDVDNLGYKDDLVSVKPGYARNYLIPRGMAIAATVSNKKMLEETLRQRQHKATKVLEEAQAMVDKLKKATITIPAKVGEGGKIFGSVNTVQLADAIKSAGIEVERKNITIKEEPIKNIGKYSAEVQLHRDVTETIEFEVVEG